MDKKELEKIYWTNTNLEASKIIGVSVPTLQKMITESGIEKKGSGRPYSKNKVQVVR